MPKAAMPLPKVSTAGKRGVCLYCTGRYFTIHRESRGRERGEEEAAGRLASLIIFVIESASKLPEGVVWWPLSLTAGACD